MTLGLYLSILLWLVAFTFFVGIAFAISGSPGAIVMAVLIIIRTISGLSES